MIAYDGAGAAVPARVRDEVPDLQRLRAGTLGLLAIKDSDIRIRTIEQARDAVDRGIHAGGAFSAIIPLVSLFYGGYINIDVEDPTRRGQDMFVLSKGHAVAALASIFAELGYFDKSVLTNSRSYESILNGHPGPILPGVHISTGPLGQGLSVAQGFAITGQTSPRFNVYCMTGDGELQEGPVWEAVMYSAYKRLDNLCVLVDRNNGQLDNVERLVFPLPDLAAVFESFGWQVYDVDATKYEPVCAALDRFRHGERNGRPTAIICRTTKGHGAFSNAMNGHKMVMPDALVEQELAMQTGLRRARVAEFNQLYESLSAHPDAERLCTDLLAAARCMHIRIEEAPSGGLSATAVVGPMLTRRAPVRDKAIRYDPQSLPKIDPGKEYSASSIISAAMKVFAKDPRVVSIDADLASTSGLEAGIAAVDQSRALNVGVAEANMMNIGEAFAALGYNAWVSTFCPFFDWKVLRRIAVGQQERMESIARPDGWLSEGHGLDLTFVATAPNFETRTNGATHMGNDDCTVFDGLAHLKIIDVSCPQQLLGILKWVMAGNRGLVYLRVMRAGSPVLYGSDFEFEFGKGYAVRGDQGDAAVIISSGRGVHEAIAASSECAARGLRVGVIDMPSIDEGMLLNLYDSGKVLCVAEQNNGYIWRQFCNILTRRRDSIRTNGLIAVNTLRSSGRPQFIHSAMYGQLLNAFGLSPRLLAETIARRVES